MSSTNEEYEELVNRAAAQLGFPENYETQQLVVFCRAIENIKRFIDVGANKGLYSYIANLLMTNCTISLVEANPELARDLVADIEKWPQNGNKLEVHQVGASDTAGEFPFYVGEQDTRGTLSEEHDVQSNSVVVKCERLDTLFTPLDETLLKIDVEGLEYRVLDGARNLLTEKTRLFVELHGWGDPAKGKYPFHVLGLMRGLGYSVQQIADSYAYDFQRSGFLSRSGSYLRYAPILGAKLLVRLSGLRPLIYRLVLKGPGDSR